MGSSWWQGGFPCWWVPLSYIPSNTSIIITNKSGDSGSPCRKPHKLLTNPIGLPFTKIENIVVVTTSRATWARPGSRACLHAAWVARETQATHRARPVALLRPRLALPERGLGHVRDLVRDPGRADQIWIWISQAAPRQRVTGRALGLNTKQFTS